LYILGINAYHAGASACLIRDGQLVAAVEEERFNRLKYWAGFPLQSIRYCLDAAGIQPGDLDHIGISRDPGANLHKKVLYVLSSRPGFSMLRDRIANSMKVKDLRTAFIEGLNVTAPMKAEFHNVEHHRAHLASAFFVSPYKEAALLSVDGMGDFVSTMWGIGRHNKIEVQDEISFPHSLGIFYTAVSQWLGFTKYGDEGKVMGLAPYGKPEHMDRMRKIVRVLNNGSFELDLDYFVHHAEGATMTWSDGSPTLGLLYSEKLVELLGPAREPKSEISAYHHDIAASLQAILEEAEMALVQNLQRSSGMSALCMAGGVALNSVFNGKILPNTGFKDIYIQPAAGDAGTAMGVCYYIHHHVLGNERKYELDHAYTGPEYSQAEIEDELSQRELKYERLEGEQLTRAAAQIIADGNVLGWFQGRMEWGPRALGNRSIVADPRRGDMKDILNARIKHREPFRPFAPSILSEKTAEYFDQSYPDPFMLKVYSVLPEKHSVIPAVTHVDGTGRLQTVHRETNPLYWQLIKSFEELTGVPVVLNTSFNENEPIVCTPAEAIECFLRTRMDALALGNCLIRKTN
jgi:carbamoyltransferase